MPGVASANEVQLMQVELDLEGFREASNALESLPGSLATQAFGRASRKAAAALRKHVRRAAPRSKGITAKYKKEGERSGELRRQIQARGRNFYLYTRQGRILVRNGYSQVFINFKGRKAPYAGIVLYGTEKKGAPGPKRGAPYTDFINKGVDPAKGEMYAVATKEMIIRFDEAVQKVRAGKLTGVQRKLVTADIIR